MIKLLNWISLFFIVTAVNLQGAATNRYVATNAPSPGYPYDSWDKAGANIIDVVNAANANNAGDMVIISNGIYYLTNQICVTNTIVTNFTGDRARVIINGNYNVTTNRCFYMNHADAIVSGFTITNGYADINNLNGSGGGVYITKGTLNDCLITGNSSAITNDSEGGGGIYITAGTASHCSVIGNVVIGQNPLVNVSPGGGGVRLEGATAAAAVLTNCYVAYNIASNQAFGGGIVIYGGKVLNCIIFTNSALGSGTRQGGGIMVHSGIDAEIINCTIYSNYSGTSGGAIYAGGVGGTLLIRNNLIMFNTSAGTAGGIGNLRGTVLVDSCTIISNTAASADGGSGIYFGTHSSIARMTSVWNCIIYDNYREDLYSASGYCKTAVVYSCVLPKAVTDGFVIDGVVTNPPLFLEATSENYRLNANSPCINAGANREWMSGAADRDGLPRILYGTVDMGAYERINAGTIFIIH